MLSLRVAKYTAGWPFWKRLLFVLLLLISIGGGGGIIAFLLAGQDQWKQQVPKYSVGIEHEGLVLLNVPKMLLIKKGFKKDEFPVAFFKWLQSPFYNSAMQKIPSYDGERVYWEWVYEMFDLHTVGGGDAKALKDFHTIATAYIGNKYLHDIWRYYAIEHLSEYFLKSVKETPYSESKNLRNIVIETRLKLIEEMDIEAFLQVKYSAFLQEKIPVSDEQKYTPFRFLFNTYEEIIKNKPFSCDMPFIHELFRLQNKIEFILDRYKTVTFSPEYQEYFREDSVSVKNIFRSNTQTLKKKCNLS